MRGVNTLDSKEQGKYKNFTIEKTKEQKEKNEVITTQVESRNGNLFMRAEKRKSHT